MMAVSFDSHSHPASDDHNRNRRPAQLSKNDRDAESPKASGWHACYYFGYISGKDFDSDCVVRGLAVSSGEP
jgi:hypothetical protein